MTNRRRRIYGLSLLAFALGAFLMPRQAVAEQSGGTCGVCTDASQCPSITFMDDECNELCNGGSAYPYLCDSDQTGCPSGGGWTENWWCS